MISVDHLCYHYKGGRPILRDVSFELDSGRFLAVLGNNGAGKSTLLKCVAGILPPAEGSVYICGGDASKMSAGQRARLMAFMPQKSGAPKMTVYDAILLGRMPYMGYGPSSADRAIAEETVEKMGLREMRDRHVCDLSGGEFQKVALARALCQKPKILLLDEPTSNLDIKNRHETLSMVSRAVKEEGIAAIIAMHDIGLAMGYCEKFLALKGRRLLSCGGIEMLTEELAGELYGIPVILGTVGGRRVAVPVTHAGAPKDKESR